MRIDDCCHQSSFILPFPSLYLALLGNCSIFASYMIETLKKVKAASKELAMISDEKRNKILESIADAIAVHEDELLEANAQDLALMDKNNPL